MAAAVEGHDPPRRGEGVTHAVEQEGAVGEPTVQEEHGLLPAPPLLHPCRVPVDVHVGAHGRRAYAGRAPVTSRPCSASGRVGGADASIGPSDQGGPMTRRDVSIPTPDGSCDASLHTPDGAGPWPAVIMFPDAGGVRPTFHDMAQQLADLGYAVLLPNVYYRVGDFEPFDMLTVFGDQARAGSPHGPRRQPGQGVGGAGHGRHARLPRRAARGGRHQGRHDGLLHGRRAVPDRRGALPRPGGLPRRPSTVDASRRMRRTAPTCWPAR